MFLRDNIRLSSFIGSLLLTAQGANAKKHPNSHPLDVNVTEYKITSVTPLLVKNNDVVSVEFKTENPSVGDFIAAFSPADVNVNNTAPIAYGDCSHAADYMTTGKGVLNFEMTTLSADVAFYLFVGSTGFFNTTYPGIVWGTPQTTFASRYPETVQFKDRDEPIRVRIIPTGNVNEYRIMWASEFSRRPILKFGSASGKYDNYEHALSAGIDKRSLCGAPANSSGWYDMGLTHTATLEAHGPVYYIVGDEELGVWSKEELFTPPPGRGKSPSTRPTRVVLLADMGIGSNQEGHSYGQSSATQVGGETFPWQDSGYPSYNTSKSIERFIESGEVDVVFLNGDISYANGYIVSWQYYLNMISSFSRKIAFLNTLGNHEVDSGNDPNVLSFGSSSGGECGVLSTTLLPFPDERATLRSPWWSYDVGLIHFVGMSTEHNFSMGSEQYLWIENDLRNVDRKITPWVIFGGHRPVYVNSNLCCKENVTCGTNCYLGSDQGVSTMLQESIEPLLYRFHVNIAFSGHLHEIQRQAAVHKGGINELLPGAYLQNAVMVDSLEIPSDASTRHYDGKIAFHDDPQATVYMLIGTAGQGFQVRPMASTPVWNEETFLEYGYGIVTAVNATCLVWETIRSADDSVIDKMVIVQSLDNLESGFGSQNDFNQKHVVAFYSASILFIILFAVWRILITRSRFIRNKMRSQSVYIKLDVDDREVVDVRNPNKSYGAVTIDI